MNDFLSRGARRAAARRRARRRRSTTLAIAGIAALAGFGAWIVSWQGSSPAPGGASATTPTTNAGLARSPTPARPAFPQRLRARELGGLNSPVQDAAGAAAGSRRAVLAAGLTATDTSRADIISVSGGREAVLGRLPGALHDSAAVAIGGAVYLFGGGDGVRQLDQILRIDTATGASRRVGSLPAPSSDQAGTALGDTAYIVGGFDGSAGLDTIVAWTPAGGAHVVAHLPSPLRYAAVTAVDGRIVIAGGTTPDGGATDLVQAFDPSSGRIDRVGRLPSPTTHATAAVLGTTAYVIGGRGRSLGTALARIVAVDPLRRRVATAGSLAAPLSDLTAVGLDRRILLVGGRGPTGTVATLTELTAGAAHTPAAAVAPAAGAFPPTPPDNVYAFDGPRGMSPAVRGVPYRIYVPNSESDTETSSTRARTA